MLSVFQTENENVVWMAQIAEDEVIDTYDNCTWYHSGFSIVACL
jgi:hypothetical protein